MVSVGANSLTIINKGYRWIYTAIALLLFLSYSLLNPCPAHASLTVLDKISSVSLNGHSDVLRDPSGALTIGDVTRPGIAARFTPLSKRFSAGYTKDAVWLRFTLQRSAENTEKQWWIEIYPSFLDYVTLYEPDGPDTSGAKILFTEKRAGRLLPMSAREIAERNFVFVVNLTDTKPHTYYIRAQTFGTMFIDAKIWDIHSFARSSGTESVLLGGFYGILGLLLVLNLIFWFILRDRLFIIYALFLVSLALALFPANGLASLYLFPDTPLLSYMMSLIGISLIMITGSLLLEELIPLDKRGLWRRSFVAVRAFAVFSILMILAGRFRIVGGPLMFVGLYLSLACIAVSALGIYRRTPSAKLYGITFMVYYIGGIMISVRNLNLFGQSYPIMDNAYQIGSAIHMILIQVAIALRFYRVEQERKEAQQRALTISIETEKELANKAREWEETFNSISDMVIMLNRDFRIIKANSAAARFLRTGKEELINQKCYMVSHHDHCQPVNCPCRTTFDTGKPALQEFYEPRFECFLEVTTSPILNSAGEVVAAVHITKDISWRKKMEEEMMRTQKLESLSVLAGGIAHDFNNMLTVIVSSVTLAKMYAGDNAIVNSKLLEAEKEIMHARELTNQLLTFARGGAPVRKLSSFRELLRDTVKFSIKGSQLKCEPVIPADLWPAEIDRVQISQVISNLVINARQAMPGGGLLKVYAANEIVNEGTELLLNPGRYVRITVEDSGTGIAPEHLSRIFDPFFSTKAGGSGLGLSISYSIVRKHNGCINVKSRGAAGSIFDVYLPASAETCVMEPALAPVELKGTGRVLLMDDDEKLLKNVSEMLSALGYEVETARNGEEAIILYKRSLALSRFFDAAVMDMTVIGGMGGRACLEEIIKLGPLVKCIVMSGYSDDPVLAEYRKYGFREALSKPFSIDELHRTLQAVIKDVEMNNA